MPQPELSPIGHAISGAAGASLSNTIVYPVFPSCDYAEKSSI